MTVSKSQAWIMATRPKTLWAGISPVIIGAAMAFSDGMFHAPSALCALVGAVLLQIGANFANDYSDFARGTDTPDRIGPTRVTQAGLIAPHVMKAATLLVFVLACVPGLYIVARGGWPFVIVGLASIMFAILYTGGPRPLGYLGLGDILVLVFFGPVATGGTYYLQTFQLPATIVVAGLAPGLFSVAILTVNNLRDIEEDSQAGKKTLAVRYGRAFARFEYAACIVLAAGVVPMVLCFMTWGHVVACLVSTAVLLLAIPVLRVVVTQTDGPSLNKALASTGKLLLVFAILFSLGWIGVP